ncbi:MAG: site-specific DNA-methyltransferase [bacterium]|nr:site-specific DNA-methyltransferase [bacterium]
MGRKPGSRNKNVGKGTGATGAKHAIESYEHKDKKRINNPPVGLVTPDTDPDAGQKKTYTYDPHLDPQLQWTGKVENTSFQVPTVSLHVHDRIDSRTIIEAVRRTPDSATSAQLALFQTPEENPPLREAIEFYQHAHGWSNRLIAGDSLLVMNSLIEKEGMAGKVQMVYIDPPYGIKYGSNFQPFVNKRDVKDGKDEDLTAEPEQIRAFRDTWELGIHSYLTYLRDRLLLASELLTESGSVFVQIGEDNLHLVRSILDELFGTENFMSMITFRVKNMPFGAKHLENMYDHLVWYAKDKKVVKFRRAFLDRASDPSEFSFIELSDGKRRKITEEERAGKTALPNHCKVFSRLDLYSSGYTASCIYDFEFEGTVFRPETGKSWKTTKQGMQVLNQKRRLMKLGTKLYFIFYHDDYPLTLLNNFWDDTAGGFSEAKSYVVQTHPKVIQRCLLMTTDPGDLVFDPTCGSGTTAYVAEQWGRRWITCDTSRVALTLTRQRMMTAFFNYYELAHPQEGVSSGFQYKIVPHVTLGSIANNESPATETLYDQPLVDRKKKRVSGPFTFEAVPAPAVKSVEEILKGQSQPADVSIARSGETLRQGEWRDELLRTGIRGKAGQFINFARLEPVPGCRWLHADGETRPSAKGADSVRKTDPAFVPQRIVVSFGPEYAPLEQRQVAQAIDEAQTLVPKPKLIVFAAFQFDPEAAKDIDETNWPGVTLLKAQMNADLLTDDLKKKRASNESFWLIGQPDVRLEHIAKGEDKGKYRVRVEGFDYYNTKTGGIESGGAHQIAVWLLDTDYDGRSLYPSQVFFPQAGESEGWARLANNLKAEIDEELIEAYRGTESLPFAAGKHKRIAIKIVDDRGIESLKMIEVE